MARGRKAGQKMEKREDRNRKIASAIANMEMGEMISITPFAHSVNTHPDTIKDLLDLFDSLGEIGFKTIRDNNRKIIKILRIEKNLDIEKTLTEIRKDILDIKMTLKENKVMNKNGK